MSHTRQKNPYEQEVKIENRVRTEGSQRFADYAFFIAPNFRDVKFFVEAKKPAHDLANPNYYHQAIRYGWNQKTPIAILTDFAEFHILDSRYKPDIKTALDRKIEVYHYTDYADEEIFKKIFFLIGRDAVASGSLEKYADTLPKPRGKAAKKGITKARYQHVDEAFLELLDGYRDTLAHAFKNKNAHLDGDALTEAVQRTLDRLVFIRFLEDKGIEEKSIVRLGGSSNSRPMQGEPKGSGAKLPPSMASRFETSAWQKFLALCRSMEPKYNGLVFKQHQVIDSDDFVPPDNDTFAGICDELADPASPYDFNSIPISILGSIYERFLGKVVTTTEKRAKVIEKPEVRKAGGVYYTPEYIVRYIVSETLGKLLYGDDFSSPSQGEVSRRSRDGGVGEAVDPLRSKERIASPLVRGTNEERKFKLAPAEVAKLRIADIACGSGSFLLEVYSQLLEYHTRYYNAYPEKAKKGDTETREGKTVLSHKKRQEILVNNIYGVDIDFQATEVTQLSLYLKLMEDVTMNDAYQFSLLKERMLPDLRRNIVCGNSLIGRDIVETLHATSLPMFDDDTEHTLKPMNFEDAFPHIFSPLERGQRGVSDCGFDVVVGNPPYRMLQPHNTSTELLNYLREHFFAADFKIDLFHLFMQRGISVLKDKGMLGYIVPSTILNNVYVESLRSWIMDNARVNSIAICPEQVFATADVHTSVLIFTREANTKDRASNLIRTSVTSINKFKDGTNGFSHTLQQRFLDLPGKVWNVLLNETNGPLIKRLNETHIKLEKITSINRGLITGDRGKYFSESKKSKKHVPIIAGSDVERYYTNPASEYVLFDRPTTSGGCWDKEVHFAPHKLVIRQIGFSPTASILTQPIAVTGNIFTIMGKDLKNELYILGIVNSRLIKYYWGIMFADFKTSFPQVTIFSLFQLPIRTINFDDAADKARHDRIVALVEQMLKAKEKHAAATTESEKNRLDIQIESLDRQIDEAVYELYGLTEEERRIVEGKA